MSRGILRVAVLALLVSLGTVPARADVSTEEGGSILVYPKIINANGRDTIIQLVNTGNTLEHLHCFYTDARPRDPRLPVGPTNPALWQEVDFFLWLTRQQPTVWTASQGRALNPLDGSGLDPGSIPGVVNGFTGELVCVEVDSSGNPITANRLQGDATLVSASGDSSKYSAIAIQSGPLGGDSRTLLLDNEHYSSCPNTLIFNHFATNAPDPVAGPPDNFGDCGGAGCPITTELTLMPCARDYENQRPGTSTVSLLIYNEYEERFSATVAVTCWANLPLNRVSAAMSFSVLGTPTAQTRITPVPGTVGVLGVAEEFHHNEADAVSAAAWNLQTEGSFYEPSANRTLVDEIVLVGE